MILEPPSNDGFSQTNVHEVLVRSSICRFLGGPGGSTSDGISFPVSFQRLLFRTVVREHKL